MPKHVIVGVHITNRVKRAIEVQHLLTDFGCSIRTRLGLHDASAEACAPSGMILLEMVDDAEQCKLMLERLAEIEGVDVQKMVFEHD